MRLSGLIQPAAVRKNLADGSIKSPMMLDSFFNMDVTGTSYFVDR